MNHNRAIIKRKRALVGRRYEAQRGVVLISCIIFLLLILMLLKMSLSSSRVSEQKSGIDYEIMTAQESAQLALREAESEILSVVSKAKLSSCKGSKLNSAECEKNFKQATELAWIMASAQVSSGGSGTAVEEINPCSAKKCSPWESELKKYANNAYKSKKFNNEDRRIIKEAATKVKEHAGFFYKGKGKCDAGPLWHCVKWSSGEKGENYFSENEKTASLAAIEADGIRELGKKYDVAPRYIIERFLPGEVDMPGDASLLFRVTAVGFGQSGGSDENVTNAIFQANYVL